MTPGYPYQSTLRPDNPDFLDLPWDQSLDYWSDICPRLEEVTRGPSRHTVLFVNYDGRLYALKQLPPGVAETEYNSLVKINDSRVPAVTPVGFVNTTTVQEGELSVLITRFLNYSIPFRMLFTANRLLRYREHLLDAIAGLLVQLHLAGIYWGDCSLSNTLFRRDAGALRAYLVDAETAQIDTGDISPANRHDDLLIMEENIEGELADLAAEGNLAESILTTSAVVGHYIRQRYQSLWQEITREDIIYPTEHYRIQERIRALNSLGFSVGDVELYSTQNGNQLRLRVVVTDRNFHHDQLLNLTGIEAEEMQAQKMMNEIQEIKATLSQDTNQSTPLSVAAHYWSNHIYQPTINMLKPLIQSDLESPEYYCQILEHKWFLSEKAHRDVGHETATSDYLRRFSSTSE